MSTSVLEAWQAIDLVNVQLALDEQASSVADMREIAVVSRRDLAEKTKEFKKLFREASVPRTEHKKLLKMYQEEVDSLTNRAKFAENCFLSMYRLIREAPDPSDELSQAARSMFNIKFENDKLSEQLKTAQAKNEELSNGEMQNANIPEESENSRRTIEQEIRSKFEAKHAQLESLFETKLENIRSDNEEELQALNLQLELAQGEADRLADECKVLEARISPNHQSSKNSDDQVESILNELQISKDEKQALQVKLEGAHQMHEAAIAKLSEQIFEMKSDATESNSRIKELESQLSNAVSEEEHLKLRSQLMVIQKELYQVESHDEEMSLDSLETWLLASTRSLKQELITTKRTIKEQEDTIQMLQESEHKLQDALGDQTNLASKLEEDLLLQGTGDSNVIESKGKLAAAHSMLQAVCDQRDRLRQQSQTWEAEVENQRKNANELELKIRTLTDDNLQLYERIKFLHNYKASERSTLLASRNDDLEKRGVAVTGLGRGVEHKYRDVYEAEENPLETFKMKETARAFDRIPVVERFVLNLFNFFLSRSRGRLFLAGYVFFFHLLLMVCIF